MVFQVFFCIAIEMMISDMTMFQQNEGGKLNILPEEYVVDQGICFVMNVFVKWYYFIYAFPMLFFVQPDIFKQ